MKDVNLELDLIKTFPDLIVQNSQPLHNFISYSSIKDILFKEDLHLFMSAKVDYLLSDSRAPHKTLLALKLGKNAFDPGEIKQNTFIYKILSLYGIPFIIIEEDYTPEMISSLRLYLYLQNMN